MNFYEEQPDTILFPTFLPQPRTGELKNPDRNPMKGPGSSVSGLSMRSGRSRDQPPTFSGDGKSCASMDSAYPPSLPGSSASAVGVSCEVCSKPAVKSCLTCADSYCMACITPHYFDPDLGRHQLQDLQAQGHDVTELTETDRDQDPDGTRSRSSIQAAVPPPEQIQFPSVKPDSVTVSWSPPKGSPGSYKYRVTRRRGQEQYCFTVERLKVEMKGLLPGEKYHFTVATLTEDGRQSTCVEKSVRTEIPAPENLCVDLQTTPASVKWTKPAGVDQVSYLLELLSVGECLNTVHTDLEEMLLSDLQLETKYLVTVSTVLGKRGQSKPVCKSFTNGVRERPDDLRIVLLGNTGVGKSATGNTILRTEAFKAEASHESVTSRCQKETAEVDGRQITVIDTPGLFDAELGTEDIQGEITNCIPLVLPGPHVFLLLIQVGRFTDEEKQAVDVIKSTFGENSIKYTIVVFTRGDDDLSDKSLDQYLGTTGSPIMNLIDQCGKRYHMLDNETSDRTQVSVLLDKIDFMVAANGGGYYTSRIFQQMEKTVQEEREEREEQLVREKEDMRKNQEYLKAKHKAEIESLKQTMKQERQNADEKMRRREEWFCKREQGLQMELKEQKEEKENMHTEMKREREKRKKAESRKKKVEHIWTERYERVKTDLEKLEREKQRRRSLFTTSESSDLESESDARSYRRSSHRRRAR